MQIYLPTPKLSINAAILHELDMLAQRNVGLTILESLAGKAKGWYWHPGVTMWIGHEPLLAHACILIDDEWAKQESKRPRNTPAGVRQLSNDYVSKIKALGLGRLPQPPAELPWWWGHKRFHEGNKSVMIRHNAYWYGRLFKDTPNDLCDWWPRRDKDTWTYGPTFGPNGDASEYFINNVPIYQSAKRMDDHEFVRHVNRFHNLSPGSKRPIDAKDATLDLMRAIHDRFHQKRFYSTHDHRG